MIRAFGTAVSPAGDETSFAIARLIHTLRPDGIPPATEVALMDPQTVAMTWRIVIICGTVFFCWLVGWLAYMDYRKKQLQFEERRVAIENGMEPPPLPLPPAAGWPGVKQVEMQLKYAERKLRIEKGLPVPDEEDREPWLTTPKVRRDFLRRGLVATCLGLALALAYVGLAVTRVPADGRVDAQAWAIGLAPLFLLYGVANLIYQRYVPEEPPQASQKKGS